MSKKRFKKDKKMELGNSLCSKKFLCEFCDFLKENLRFFVATLWQHCSSAVLPDLAQLRENGASGTPSRAF